MREKKKQEGDSYVIRSSNTNEKAELLELQCKNCGGFLELTDRTHGVCPYCGQKYLIDEAKGTIINVQVDYSGSQEMKEAVGSAKRTLIWFLIAASVIAMVIFAFNIAARKSVFSTSDADAPADENGMLLRIFCKDVFGKEYGDITAEELAGIRFIRCSYVREGGETFNRISYSFTDYEDCESEEEFQDTVRVWTYRTKMVSWPSDYTMFTGLTRIDTTDAVWLSLLKFSPDSKITWVDTDDRLDTVTSVLNPEEIKVLHVGIMGRNLDEIGQFQNLAELEVDTTMTEQVVDISGIGQCKNLKRLKLRCGERYDGLENLKDLKELKSLYIDKTPSSEWEFLEGVPWLEELSIYTGQEADLSVFNSLPHLRKVDFLDKEYIPVGELERLKGTQELTLAVKEPECLEILGGFEGLKALDLHMAINEYQIPVDLSPLAGLAQLEEIYLDNFWGGQFTGVEKILGLSGLRVFRLGRGAGSDAQILMDKEALEGGRALEEMGFLNCTVKNLATGEAADFSFIGEFPGLKRLYLDGCGLEDISFVERLADLRACSLMDNDIRDLSPLLQCKKLEAVSVDEEAARKVRFPGDVAVNTEMFVRIYE